MVTGRGEKKKEGRGRDGKMRGFLSAFSGSYSLHQCSLYFGCFTSGVFSFFLQKRRGPREGQEPVLQVLHSEIVFFPLSW